MLELSKWHRFHSRTKTFTHLRSFVFVTSWKVVRCETRFSKILWRNIYRCRFLGRPFSAISKIHFGNETCLMDSDSRAFWNVRQTRLTHFMLLALAIVFGGVTMWGLLSRDSPDSPAEDMSNRVLESFILCLRHKGYKPLKKEQWKFTRRLKLEWRRNYFATSARLLCTELLCCLQFCRYTWLELFRTQETNVSHKQIHLLCWIFLSAHYVLQ